MNEWIECEGCSLEFKVEATVQEVPEYCPFCGDTVDYEIEQLEFEDE